MTVTGSTTLNAGGDLTGTDVNLPGLDAESTGVMTLTSADLGNQGNLTGGSVILNRVSVDALIATANNGDVALADTGVSGKAEVYSTGGQSFTDVTVGGDAELLGTGTGLFQIEDLTVGATLLLNAGDGSIMQNGGALTVADTSIIYAGGSVSLDGAANDFGTSMVLFALGGATIVDANDIQLGLGTNGRFIEADGPATAASTNVGDFAAELLGERQQSFVGQTAGVVGGAWDLQAAGSVNIDGTLDGGGSFAARANNAGGSGGTVRFGDFVGQTARLGDVIIDNALDPTIGQAAGGASILDANPDRDLFFADSLSVRDSTGTLELPRNDTTDLTFDLNITYFGVNLSGPLNYSASPGLTAVDVAGAINGQRSQAVGLLPIGRRGAAFQFNNCEIGNISDCSNEPPDLTLPQIDFSLPSIFSIDFETLGDVYVNFGNEELWAVPTLFQELEDEEGRQ